MNLHTDTYNREKLDKVPTRNGFGEELAVLGSENEQIVGLCADLTESTRMHHFAEKFPNRFTQVGVAEQNLMGVAAGLAIEGKIPFAASYAVFSPGRNWDQLRVSVCYSQANVKVIGGHAGVTVGPDGATHQALEDIAITRVLPNMTVVVPADYEQAKKAARAVAEHVGPTYIRLGRSKIPAFTTTDTPFELGKADVYREGSDITLVATGVEVYEALEAAEMLKDEVSIEVINCHTIKPIDVDTIVASARKTGRVVTVEEHQILGGLGGAVAEVLSEHHPVPVHRIGMPDTFGQSGEPEQLLDYYGMSSRKIVERIRTIIT